MPFAIPCPTSRRLGLPLALGLLGLVAACGSTGPRWRGAAEPDVPPTERLHALLINGGSRKAINYRSHLQHVEGVLAELRATGVAPQRIVVFSSDGGAPEADLAVRDAETEPDAWLLPPEVERSLRPLEFVDSQIAGVALRPARKDGLRAWFEQDGARLRPGDTLLLYVTDHGERNPRDLANNTISLWEEDLSVAELRDLVALLAPGVRVVMLMSQCYGGSFANAIYPAGAEGKPALPDGGVCGYFASTPERRAYGCYPENRGKDGVGHSFAFLQALAALGRFPEANRRVQVTDDTPDVPHRSSDFFLRDLLRVRARAAGRPPGEFMDELLAEAWKDRGAWEPEIRLLDRIGHRFGSFSPRSFAELDAQAKALPEFSSQLGTYAERWRDALVELERENLRRFLEPRPAWSERLASKRVAALDGAGRRALMRELLAELVPFSRAGAVRWARLAALREKADTAAAARYRTEVRLGAVLRMRMLLRDVAGRTYLASRGAPAERDAFTRLTGCEDLTLDATPAAASAAALDAPEPFPPLAEERRLVERVTPAWLGVRYRPLTDAENARLGTRVGAVKIITIYPDHPAARSLEVNDVVIGPPGAPFEEPHALREWTMRSEIEAPTTLEILRDGRRQRATLRLAPFPLALPELPGPPKIGSAAPSLDVDLVRGATELAAGKPRLLFFWATWCLICKHALPEVLAFARARDTEVVAITDEDPETLRPFLASFTDPFPEIVASDLDRAAFMDYGVSGVPTLVLLDAAGVVRHYQSGYRPETGLTIDGWKWAGARRRAESAPVAR